MSPKAQAEWQGATTKRATCLCVARRQAARYSTKILQSYKAKLGLELNFAKITQFYKFAVQSALG